MKRALTNTAVKSAKAGEKPRKLTDGGGLFLLITPAGSKLWRYKFRLNGKEQVFSLGGYPSVSLANARVLHDEARAQVHKGVHPLEAKKRAAMQEKLSQDATFQELALQLIAQRESGWTTTYARQMRTTLERDVFPKIGALPVTEVSASRVRDILLTVDARTLPPDGKKDRGRGASTVAGNIRMWISAVVRFAVSMGHDAADPTAALRQLISRPKVRHHPHLSEKEIPGFLAALSESGAHRSTIIAIELLMLTFVRTGELRFAEWVEFDLEKKLWRIPATRMKMRRPHLVPLSDAAVQRILELWDMRGSNTLLFPNMRTPGKVITSTTINRVIERIGYGGRISGHGFRGTASTALNERGYSSRVIEKQLAHERGSRVEFAYNHAEYMEERRAMMHEWSMVLFDNQSSVIKHQLIVG